MSHKTFVIHSKSSVREKLVSAVQAFGNAQVVESKDLKEGIQILENSQDFLGWVFLEATAETKKAMRPFRGRNRNAHVIAVLENVNASEIREVLQGNVDQILPLPFSEEIVQKKISSSARYRGLFSIEETTYSSIRQFDILVDELAPSFQRVTLRGPITDDGILPEIKGEPNSTLFFDCEQLTVINSVGIKNWLAWMKSLKNNGFVNFEFDGFGPGFLQLASFVSGFLPQNSAINSFYLHYWCEPKGISRNFKFKIGRDYTETEMRIPATMTVTEYGEKNVYELDDSANVILKFFKGNVSIV